MIEFLNKIKKYIKITSLTEMNLTNFKSKKRRNNFTPSEREEYLNRFNQMLSDLKQAEIEERNRKI